MTQEHPITPLPELVEKWVAMLEFHDDIDVFTDVARWGADQELEACCEWLDQKTGRWDLLAELRTARRPKPPSLKETLLARVARIPGEGADAAYLRHWVDNESQRLVDVLHEVFKSLPS